MQHCRRYRPHCYLEVGAVGKIIALIGLGVKLFAGAWKIIGATIGDFKIKKSKISFKSEKISSESSVGRICSKNIYSPYNYPAANNTAFDGFAINSNETINLKKNKSKKFEILKVIAAGDNPNIKKVKKFSAVEVMTGALVIKPFNTVIPIKYYLLKRKKYSDL